MKKLALLRHGESERQSQRSAGSPGILDAVPNVSKVIGAMIRSPIAGNCAPWASRRGWRNVGRHMAAVWASIARG
jgi:hypothetical protein